MTNTRTSPRTAWPEVIDRARDIVLSYSTSVTLRQLFYRLVAASVIENTTAAYKRLSALTAEGRRDGTFPDLVDQGRRIHEHITFADADHGMRTLIANYRLDRTIGQPVSLYLGTEAAGLVAQLESWFGRLGVPVVALGGYSSQSYVDQVAEHVRQQNRPAILLYCGDFDPSGEDILRDFTGRIGSVWTPVRIALTEDQVADYGLIRNTVEKNDSRAPSFCAEHGLTCERVLSHGSVVYRYEQIELDALAPEDLRSLYREAIWRHWDTSSFRSAVQDEYAGRHQLEWLLGVLRADDV
jgi:hypothetical protein